MVSYGSLQHDVVVLFFEPLHGITIATYHSAAVEHVTNITPAILNTTGQGFLNLLRGSIGNASGTFSLVWFALGLFFSH